MQIEVSVNKHGKTTSKQVKKTFKLNTLFIIILSINLG